MDSLRQIGCDFLSGRFFSFFMIDLNYLKVRTQSLGIPCWKLCGRCLFSCLMSLFSIQRVAWGKVYAFASQKQCKNSISLRIRSKNRHRTSSETFSSSVLRYFLQFTVEIVLIVSVSKGQMQFKKSAQDSLSLQPYTENISLISSSAMVLSLSSINHKICVRVSSSSPKHRLLKSF